MKLRPMVMVVMDGRVWMKIEVSIYPNAASAVENCL